MMTAHKDRILITGGSGFFGINLIRHLLRKGYGNIVSLDVVDFDYPEMERIEAVKGDIRDAAAVKRCAAGARWVVHSAAALPLYKKEDIFSTDLEGTKNVLAAAHENGVERLIHVSSTAVYGIPNYHPVCEDDELVAIGPYGYAKIKAEECCLEHRKKGMCVPIVRPKTFIGPERLGIFALLYDWAQDGRNFPMIGSGKNRYQLLDVEDLCEFTHICLVADRDAVNDTFNVGAEEFRTMKEDYQAVLDRAGFGKRVVSFPKWPVLWCLRSLDSLHLSPVYKWVYETAYTDSIVSIEKAKQVLGFEPKYSNQDALIRNFQWYLENQHRFKSKQGISHRSPWSQGVLGLVKHLF
jgi:nucleoside-diphosphate-sugar epimerase